MVKHGKATKATRPQKPQKPQSQAGKPKQIQKNKKNTQQITLLFNLSPESPQILPHLPVEVFEPLAVAFHTASVEALRG